MKLIYIHRFFLIDSTVYTIYIKTEKYKFLTFYFILDANVSVMLYDGPGYHSPRLKIKDQTEMFNSTSFQCLIQVIWTNVANQVHNVSQFIRYTAYLKHFSVLKLLDENKIILNVSSKTCEKKLHKACVYMFRSPDNSVINTTIYDFAYSGRPYSKCNFGGVVLFDKKVREFIETFTLCNKDSHLNLFSLYNKNLYSTNSAMILIIYSYSEYSNLKLNMKLTHIYCTIISRTSCKGIPLILLGKYEFKLSVVLDTCTIIQVTSSFYNVENARLARVTDLYQVYSIRYAADIYNLPACPLKIFIIQSRHNNKTWLYETTGFLEHFDGLIEEKSYILTNVNYTNDKSVVQGTVGRTRFLPSNDTYLLKPNHRSKHFWIAKTERPNYKFAVFQIHLNTFSESWINLIFKPINITEDKQIQEVIPCNFKLYFLKYLSTDVMQALTLELELPTINMVKPNFIFKIKAITEGQTILFNKNFLARSYIDVPIQGMWDFFIFMTGSKRKFLIAIQGLIVQLAIIKSIICHANSKFTAY